MLTNYDYCLVVLFLTCSLCLPGAEGDRYLIQNNTVLQSRVELGNMSLDTPFESNWTVLSVQNKVRFWGKGMEWRLEKEGESQKRGG